MTFRYVKGCNGSVAKSHSGISKNDYAIVKSLSITEGGVAYQNSYTEFGDYKIDVFALNSNKFV